MKKMMSIVAEGALALILEGEHALGKKWLAPFSRKPNVWVITPDVPEYIKEATVMAVGSADNHLYLQREVPRGGALPPPLDELLDKLA